ncbi:uncharacterized protein LOC122028823 [Zingiber officinale]|nr:uncharacterized protein LOC122028823 [Zingiber officinale]
MMLSSCCCQCSPVCCWKSSLPSDLPNHPKSQWGDAQHAATDPPPVPITLEKKPSCEKVVIEQKSASEGKCTEILLKSSLKKPRVSDSEQNVKGNVKWLDFLGKELVEVKEFEPTEWEESDYCTDDSAGCVCVIQ